MQPTVEHSTYIEAPPADVYRLLATGEGLDSWFTTGAEVDARPGGSITFRWRNFGLDAIEAEDGGPVLEAVPGEVFSFHWSPGHPDRPTTVRIELKPYGRGTRVDLTETGFDAGDEKSLAAALMVATGWGEALTFLKYALEVPDAYTHPCRWRSDAETSAA
ncbi:MAG: SRPBCC domain-containing protein [Acidobacteriota bacterium]